MSVTGSPSCSIVIPAHDEEAVIGRLLTALRPDAALEVVVVANGCSDRTAEIAREFPGVRVVELGQGSKAAALREADRLASAFPRFYVDADIVLPRDAVEQCIKALDGSAVLAAAPDIRFDDTGASWLVRQFYRHLRRTPWIQQSLIGVGVYVLTADGRARFGEFPDLIADDLYVAGLFLAAERQVVTTATFTVMTPRTVAALLAVRRRVYYGNLQAAHARQMGSLSPLTPATGLSQLVQAQSPVAALVYFGLNAVAKVQARLAWRKGGLRWTRDDTSRQVSARP